MECLRPCNDGVFVTRSCPAKKERDNLKQAVRPDTWEGEWPLNLDVVDALIRCFKKPYKEAYSSDCRSN